MKIGEFRCWIFSYIEAKFSSIAALWFKILTKIGGTKTYIKIRVSYWMEYIYNSKLGFITTRSYYQYIGQLMRINVDIDENILAQTFFSAGNIISTAEDLNKWYRGLFDGQIISKNLLEEAHTPHIFINKTRSYGYGWIIDDPLTESEKEIKKQRIIWHNGKISGGFTSSVIFHPYSSTLSILLSNREHPNGVIENLSIKTRYYVTKSIDRPTKRLIVPVSRVRMLRDNDLRSLKERIDFSDDPSRFRPISEVLKEIQ